MSAKVFVLLMPVLAGLAGGIAGGVVTLKVVLPDMVQALRDDQAPVRSQARRDIDNMRRELKRNGQSSGSASSWGAR